VTLVHQVLSSAGPYDAVTAQALAWQDLLERSDRAGGVHADAIDPRTRGVDPIRRLEPGADDLLVLRYSAFAPRLRPVLDRPQRKLLLYHNVTPPRYFWRHHPGVAVACALGRGQLPSWARSVQATAADSTFNAGELEQMAGLAPGSAHVVPILFEPDRLGPRGKHPQGSGPLVLAVGRLVPNKRHDLILAAFADYQRSCAPEARLLVVGEPLSPSYRRLVEDLARRSGARNVTIAGGLPQAELNSAYAEADVLLSMSEHEGFCVPLLEAFHFGLPVVARPAGAMPEVAADAVLWTGPSGDGPGEADPAVAAELIHLAVTDGELREELHRRGRARLAEYTYERTAERIEASIKAALS
jgi:L-malate glycosyltransferase